MIRSTESRDLPGFRLRGHEVTRLESFSDAVFGFALTLLVVSLDVPKSFNDLVTTMRGFPAFALCFLLLAVIWNGHYKFCRRYGLDDGTARLLTCVMLFLVLVFHTACDLRAGIRRRLRCVSAALSACLAVA